MQYNLKRIITLSLCIEPTDLTANAAALFFYVYYNHTSRSRSLCSPFFLILILILSSLLSDDVTFVQSLVQDRDKKTGKELIKY
jgi:hypothetical protein